MSTARTSALTFLIVSVMLSNIRCTTTPVSAETGDRHELIARRWITERITFNGSDVTTEGVRVLDLKPDGSYVSTLHSGATLTGRWNLSIDESLLILDESTYDESVIELHEVSLSRLRMSWTGERETRVGRYDYSARAQ